MKRLVVVFFAMTALLLICASLESAFQGTELYLPLVLGGDVSIGDGETARWVTDLWIYNPNEEKIKVIIVPLTPGGSVGDPGYQYNPTEEYIESGDIYIAKDACYTFLPGMDKGTLYIQAEHAVLASAHSYLVFDDSTHADTAGFLSTAIPASFGICCDDKTQLLGVRKDSATESLFDFGFVEIGGGDVSLEVTLYDEYNQRVSSGAFYLRRYEPDFRRLSELTLLSDYTYSTLENARLEVEVTHGAGRLIVFGSRSVSSTGALTSIEMQMPDGILARYSCNLISEVKAGRGLQKWEEDGRVTLHVDIEENGALDFNEENKYKLRIMNGGVTKELLSASWEDDLRLGDDGNVLYLEGDQLAWTELNAGSGLRHLDEPGLGLRIDDLGVTTGMIADSSVTAAKLGASQGSEGELLSLSGSGLVWTELKAGSGLKQLDEPDLGLRIDDLGVTTDMIADQAVSPVKLSAGSGEDGDVLALADGQLMWTEVKAGLGMLRDDQGVGLGIADGGVTRAKLAATEAAAGRVLGLTSDLQMIWTVDRQGMQDDDIGRGLEWYEDEDGLIKLGANGNEDSGIKVDSDGIGILEGGVSHTMLDADEAASDKVLALSRVGDGLQMQWRSVPTHESGDLEAVDTTSEQPFSFGDSSFFTLRLAWGFPDDGNLVVIEGFKNGGNNIAATYSHNDFTGASVQSYQAECSDDDPLKDFGDVKVYCSSDPSFDMRLSVTNNSVTYRISY